MSGIASANAIFSRMCSSRVCQRGAHAECDDVVMSVALVVGCCAMS